MGQHAGDDGGGALAVLADFPQILLKARQQKLLVGVAGRAGGIAGNIVDQQGAHLGKVFHEGQRVLQLVGNAGGELAQKGHFFALHQLGLRGF